LEIDFPAIRGRPITMATLGGWRRSWSVSASVEWTGAAPAESVTRLLYRVQPIDASAPHGDRAWMPRTVR
jgi:hypothetical protein